MEQIDIRQFVQGRGEGARLISRSDSSDVFILQDGSFLKLYNETMHLLCRMAGVNLEKKITSLEPIKEVPEIIIPDTAIYDGRAFIGYAIPSAKGISKTAYDEKKTRDECLDLSLYAKEHSKLESVIKRANQKGIVFPDLLTLDNLFITNNNGNISYNFIDPDGIQFTTNSDQGCIQMSTTLGSDFQYLIPKYSISRSIYNPNLDKKSLILLYFISTFGVNLQAIIDLYNGYAEQKQLFNNVMNAIGVFGQLRELAEIALFDSKQDNHYLGSIVDTIAEDYYLSILEETPHGTLKKLVIK